MRGGEFLLRGGHLGYAATVHFDRARSRFLASIVLVAGLIVWFTARDGQDGPAAPEATSAAAPPSAGVPTAPGPPDPVADAVRSAVRANGWAPDPRETTIEPLAGGGERVHKVIHRESGPPGPVDEGLHLPTVEVRHPGPLNGPRETAVTTELSLPLWMTETVLAATPMPADCREAALASATTLCGQRMGAGFFVAASEGGHHLTVEWSTAPPAYSTVVHTIEPHRTVAAWTYPEGASR